MGWVPGGGGAGSDTDAIHDNVAAEIDALTEVTPVEGDWLLIEDTSDSDNKKKVDAHHFMRFSGARIGDPAGGNQAINATTETLITFDTEDFDSGGYADLGTNNERLTIPTGADGFFMVGGNLNIVGSANSYVTASLWKNGTGGELLAYYQTETTPATDNAMTMSTLIDAVATDYFSISVFDEAGQDSVRGAWAPHLWIVRVGV